MARIAGVDIPSNKAGEISLTYIYGIGRSLSKEILNKAEKFDFGMETFYVTSNTRAFYGLPELGAYVSHVNPDSVAEKCGLQVKDLIIEADGLTFREDPYYMERAEAKLSDGETVNLKVLRDGKVVELTFHQ